MLTLEAVVLEVHTRVPELKLYYIQTYDARLCSYGDTLITDESYVMRNVEWTLSTLMKRHVMLV